MSEAYLQSGVNLEEGQKFIQGIAPLLKSGKFSQLSFAAVSNVPAAKNFQHPVVISATDGVGTKIHLAELFDDYTTIGIDLVAMVANDILTAGCPTQFFLDYLACERIHQKQMHAILQSIHKGCQMIDCALIGGETAEHPGLMRKGSFDVAGFGFGLMDRSAVMDGQSMQAGDAIIGLPSSGVHANGFSLVRHLFLSDNNLPDAANEQEKIYRLFLQTATVLYWPVLASVLQSTERGHIRGMAHITGGGLPENLRRILPQGLVARIDGKSWTRLPVFDEIQKKGSVATSEMFRVFNMGIGFAIVCPQKQSSQLLAKLQENWHKLVLPNQQMENLAQPQIIGEIMNARPQQRQLDADASDTAAAPATVQIENS